MKIQQFIEHFFNISHDASATLIITITIFLFGYVVTIVAHFAKSLFNRRAIKKVFLDNLNNFNKSIKWQQKNIKKTIESLNIIQNTPWEFPGVQFYQISVFKEMTYTESFKAFFLGLENRKGVFVFMKRLRYLFCREKRLLYKNSTNFMKLKSHAFNKLWENLSRVNRFSERIANEFQQHLATYNEHGENRNVAINELRRLWEDNFSFTKKNHDYLSSKEFEYTKQLDFIISQFQKIPTRKRVQPYTTNRKLILPIRVLGKKFQDIQNAQIITNKALEAGHHYHEMEMLIRHFRKQYKMYLLEFNSVRRMNEKILKILS
jgi:hypothetical protein